MTLKDVASATLLVVVATISCCPGLHAQDPATDIAESKRSADRALIRTTIDGYVEAFESRDVAALAGYFTVNGEFENVDGMTVRGREGLAAAFSEFFSQTPEVTASIRSRALRFLSDATAIDEGDVTVRKGPVATPTSASYTCLLVRDGGVWRIARLAETVSSKTPSIEDLAWLIGQWRSVAGSGATIRTSYQWLPGRKFIQMTFSIEETELAFSGTQTIGVDPASGMLHSWTFESDGGIGEADWYPDETHWVLDAVGTLSDGRTLAEANLLRRIDEDTFTWQSTERLLDGQPLADLAPVRVQRLKDNDSQ